jgi:5-enolpyruvylshikimate-3-phosphate synthase
MYLGHLKSLLSSGQVSQYLPQTTASTIFGGQELNSSRRLPSRVRKFRLGKGKVYLSAMQATGTSYQENQKLDCVDLTISSLGSLFTVRNQASQFSNSGTAGYVLAGVNAASAATETIQKLLYSNDTGSTLAAVLSGTGRISPSVSNNQVAGYALGSALGTLTTAINKLTFSTDARTTLAAVTSQSRYADMGFSNSGTAGYRCFGEG